MADIKLTEISHTSIMLLRPGEQMAQQKKQPQTKTHECNVLII